MAINLLTDIATRMYSQILNTECCMYEEAMHLEWSFIHSFIYSFIIFEFRKVKGVRSIIDLVEVKIIHGESGI